MGTARNRRSSPSERPTGTVGSVVDRRSRAAEPTASPRARLAAVASGREFGSISRSSTELAPASTAVISRQIVAAGLGVRSGGRGAAGSGARVDAWTSWGSNSSTMSSMLPTPSLMAWCALSRSASPPSANPVRWVNSHKGRSRSNGWTIRSRAASATRASSPFARGNVRRWKLSRNSGSIDQHGGAIGSGAAATRWRSRGTTRLARSTRARSSAGSRGPSKRASAAMVVRFRGSVSTFHRRASTSLMRSSSRTPFIAAV